MGGSDEALEPRNARLEAQKVVGDNLDPRVLEPSPPAVTEGPWYADDPAAGGDVDWQAWVTSHPEHATWAADRWLAAYRRLPPLPSTFADTRRALHRLAAYVISPARQRTNGKMALRWTLGGFGTPFFADDVQVRAVGTYLVRQRGRGAVSISITSLADAAAFVLDGPPEVAWAKDLDGPPAGDFDEKLTVEPTAAHFLGEWYGFAWSVLEELRAEPLTIEPSLVQLWPEHFDAAFDCGHRRPATYGASPGDAAEPEPYLYVTSTAAREVPSDLWNATSFDGAILRLQEVLDASDQRSTALDFYRARRRLVGP